MNTLELQDGRTLAYAEYGDPQGAPLFYFHGFPNSRINGRFTHEAALRNRWRVIALDRPGFGGSDFQPGRTLRDWPDDVGEAADRLGIARFAVLGLSGGGPYVAACAATLPERITAAGIVSGLGPFDEPEAAKGYRLSQRIGLWLWRTFPFLIAIAFWVAALFARLNADRMVRRTLRTLPAADQEILGRPEVWATGREDVRESFRQGGRAAALEMRVYLGKWDVRPQDIPIEVLLWHGDADTIVPITMGRYMAKAIPKTQATYYPGEGHFLIVDRMEEIARGLASSARA